MDKSSWRVRNIFELPLELRFRIISFLDIRSHIRLRRVSPEYEALSNLYWQSELKKIAFKADNGISPSLEVGLLQSLKIATDAYVENGFEAIFWNCLLKCLLAHEKQTLGGLTKPIFQDFLQKFYHLMDKYDNIEYPQYLRSLYVMQVLHLLKCYPTSQSSVRLNKIGLHIHIDIEDIWLGVTFEAMSRIKLNFVPIALAELLYSYSFRRTAAFANAYQGQCYTYGYEAKPRKRHFNTQFDIFIEGTEELKSYIKAWLCAPDDFIFFPRRIFIEYFRCCFKIEVIGHVKNLWPQKILMELD